ncbi:hypothetical protein ACVW0K_007288 [Streptomyces filamentosus]
MSSDAGWGIADPEWGYRRGDVGWGVADPEWGVHGDTGWI